MEIVSILECQLGSQALSQYLMSPRNHTGGANLTVELLCGWHGNNGGGVR